MEYSTLYDLIQYLSYGTKLHMGVLFFGNHGNKLCLLPHTNQIHDGAACQVIKKQINPKRCYKCRKMALRKALRTKEAFGGICINGVYEYTRPVVIDNEVACIIYIGNILSEEGKPKIETYSCDTAFFEQDFGFEKCEAMGKLIESYVRILLEHRQDDAKTFNPLILNIKNYLYENLEYDISVTSLASLFGYNPVYLGRIFKKETGISIKEYVNKKRIDSAKKLLANNETVTFAAQKAGFNNVTYFNSIFKKLVGITPSEYKKKATYTK